MEIYLRHPEHGRKIAADFNEAEQDKKYGWEQVSKSEFFTINKVSTKDKNERDALIQEYMDRFGKSPDGRWSVAKLKDALKDDDSDDQAA